MIINFNKKLYTLKAVRSAIKEYQNLADFNMRRRGSYVQIELKNIDKDVNKIIKDEFRNYVLFKSKEG